MLPTDSFKKNAKTLIDFSGTKTGATLCFKVFYSYQLIHAFSLFFIIFCCCLFSYSSQCLAF